MKEILPKIGNTVVTKSVYVALLVAILMATTSGLIALTTLSATAILSTAFLTTLIVVLLVAIIVDVLRGKSYSQELKENFVGALFVSLFLGSVLGLFGASSVSGISGFVLAFIGGFVLFYIGDYIARLYLR